MSRYIAIANEHVAACAALNWAWMSIRPMVLAEGDDPAEVAAIAEGKRGEEITIIDTETHQPSRWWE